MLKIIESCIKWLAIMSVLWILLKTGGSLVMWTCILLFFVGKVLWEMRKIRKQREKDE